MAIFKLLRKYRHHSIVKDLARACPPKMLSADRGLFIDDALADNDELTARNLHNVLQDRWPEISVSLSTIKRTWKDLGWVATRPRYCQMIREENKAKRLSWCEKRLRWKEAFEDVVFTDECSVQLDRHGRSCFRRVKQPRKLKPRPKHPVNVHL